MRYTRNYPMKLKCVLIVLLGWYSGFSQRNTKIIFKENQAYKIDQKIDSILLIGIGSTTTRIFLDDLSHSIIRYLNSDGIAARYCYLGNDLRKVQWGYDTINKEGYKAILFFVPTNAFSYEVKGKFSTISSPPN